MGFDIVFIWIDLTKLSAGTAQVLKVEGWGFSLFHLFYLWGFKVSTPCKCGILGFPTFIGSTVITLKVWEVTVFMTVGNVTIIIDGLIFCFIREYGCYVLLEYNQSSPGIGSWHCTHCWHCTSRQ